jgi:hypothetical protein
MKKIISMIAILCSLLNARVCALDHLSSHDAELFPIQSLLVYDDSYFPINPSTMIVWSVGKTWARYHRDKKDIGETFKKCKWFDSLKSHNYECKIEVPVPYYQNRVSVGFDWAGSLDGVTTDWSLGRGNLRRIYASLGKKQDNASRFDMFTAVDMMVTLKLKLPFHTPIGHFVWALTPKLGFIYLPMVLGLRSLGDHWPTWPPEHSSFGLVTGAATSVDYYFSQWFGVYGEFCLKYNNIRWFVTEEGETPLEPYSYFTTSITFGFKTTF